MREPVQPIYTELLAIMLNSEIVNLSDEKLADLLADGYYPKHIVNDLLANEFTIERIECSGMLALTTMLANEVFYDIHPSEIITR